MNITDIVVYDIETMREMFLIVMLVPDPNKRIYRWEVSAWKNELDSFVKFVEEHTEQYWVGYNNLRFDSQVVEWILRNHEVWRDLSGLEIAALIAQKAQDTINDADYDLFPEYREESLTLKQIDLFKIHHYDNKNRRVSLKRLEFEMDLENIEEMPIHFSKVGMTRDDVVTTIHYCINDVIATYKFYKMTIGDTDHPLYKGKNMIEDRISTEEELDIHCLNYSNAKIGDEIIKKFYCESKHLDYSQLPKKGTFRRSIAIKNCIPSYVKFQTKQLKDFLLKIKKVTLTQRQDFVESIQFYGQTYTFAKGGLHNVIRGCIYNADELNDIIDIDAGGYYPATIINNSYYPSHLGKEFLIGYSKTYFKRMELKPFAKKDRKIRGVVAGLKEAGNCPYGKSSDVTSWLYDKQFTLATCISGELTLLMLIEDMELEGIHCIMANTDGATFIVPKIKRELFKQIIDAWLKETTITLTYIIEETEFKKLVFANVNEYLGIKTDGTVKLKGHFAKDLELHKNKSSRIVSIALYEYYVNRISVEQTITNHKNIFDFAIRQKASKDFHYEGISPGHVNIYDKLIRYYVSNTGEKILKIKNPECETKAVKVSQVNAGEWLMTVCNKLTNKHPMTNVNFNYYIDKVRRIIHRIEQSGRRYKTIDPNQLVIQW